jgi:hypothetical protein
MTRSTHYLILHTTHHHYYCLMYHTLSIVFLPFPLLSSSISNINLFYSIQAPLSDSQEHGCTIVSSTWRNVSSSYMGLPVSDIPPGTCIHLMPSRSIAGTSTGTSAVRMATPSLLIYIRKRKGLFQGNIPLLDKYNMVEMKLLG